MNNNLKNEVVVCLDTSALMELPSILNIVETKLKNIIECCKHATISEVVIPSIIADEIKRHINTVIQLLEQVVENIGGDKYKISKILTNCTMSKEVYLLDMLKCEELRRNVEIDDNHINFVIYLIKIINKYCESKKPKEKTKENMCKVLRYYQYTIKNYLERISNTKYSIKGSSSFFVNLISDIRLPLTFVLGSINENILKDIVELYVSPVSVNIIRIDRCMSFRDNDMIIYCHALTYSSNDSREVVLITKDKDFKDNEETWKHEIIKRIHLQAPSTIVIRI